MKRLTALTSLLTITVAVAACGGGGSSESSSSNVTANRTEPCSDEGATATSPDGTLLTCMMNTVGVLMWDTDSAYENNSGNDDSGNPPSRTGSLQAAFGGECDPNGPKKYTTGIGDANNWDYIVPLGEMAYTHITPVDHMYMYYPKSADQRAPGSFNITSPADGTIVEVSDFRKVNSWPYPDFRIVISHSCDLYSVFIHVGKLVGAAAQAEAEMTDSGMWFGSIPVKAGEVIADRSEAPKFDFSTHATDAKVALLNPDSYSKHEFWKPYTANPFDYFPADIAKAYEAKSLRTVAPIGGTLFYDIDGTAQGVWFVKDTNGYAGANGAGAVRTKDGFLTSGYWDTHLAIAPHNVDTAMFIYSIGDFDGCPCQFVSKGNVDPSTVKAGSAPTVVDLVGYDYVGPDGKPMDVNSPVRGFTLVPQSEVKGSLAFQVNSDGTMTVEKRPGKTAASFTGFGADALTYER